MFVIYKLTNIISNKIYIGQTTNFNKRLNGYKNAEVSKKTFTMPVMHAIKKYGWNNFKYDIIDQTSSLEELNNKEKYWIAFYNSTNHKVGYNARSGGNNSLFSDISRSKMSKAKIGVFDGCNNPMYGKNHTQKTKILISEKNKLYYSNPKNNPFYGKTHTELSKTKMGAAVLNYNGVNNPNAVLNYEIADLIRDDYKIIKSSIKVAKKYNVSKPTILNIIHNKRWVRNV